MVAPIILDAMDLVPTDLVEVPAGWFWMGWEHGHPGERPRHRVLLDRFAIARAPVTNREYAVFLGDGGSEPPAWWQDPRFNDPDQPVVGVSWFDATRFCRWLADREGVSYRLPTEAEWEKAARAGGGRGVLRAIAFTQSARAGDRNAPRVPGWRLAASGRVEPGGASLLAASSAALLGLRLQSGQRGPRSWMSRRSSWSATRTTA